MRFLDSIVVEGDETEGARRVTAHIDESWGIVFAQGGIVMAAMLYAAELVLARADLHLASAAATFCRPVPCGPVSMQVTALRSGRGGAQVQVLLWADGESERTPNALATVVCADRAPEWPELHGAVMPSELRQHAADAGVRLGVDDADREPARFFRQTHWRAIDTEPAEPLRRVAWFSFAEAPACSDGTWEPAMLAVPADALGLAVVPAVAAAIGAIVAPSLQMSVQFFAPARGEWLGIDSRCFHTHAATASGVATLWNLDGTLVGCATQTARLRRV